MAKLNFPNPDLSSTYEAAGITWTWNAQLGVWSTEGLKHPEEPVTDEYISRTKDDSALGNITFKKNIVVEESAQINSQLTVDNDSTFKQNAQINGQLTVDNDSTFKKNIVVEENEQINGQINVGTTGSAGDFSNALGIFTTDTGRNVPIAALGRPLGSSSISGSPMCNFFYGGSNNDALALMTGAENNSSWKTALTFMHKASGVDQINASFKLKGEDKGLKLMVDGQSGFEITSRSTGGGNKAVAMTFNSRTASDEFVAGTIETKGQNDLAAIQIKSQDGSSPTTLTLTDSRNIASSQDITNATALVNTLEPKIFTLNTGATVHSFPFSTTNLAVDYAVVGSELDTRIVDENSVPDLAGVDHSRLVPVLVKALQEALARIDALEAANT